MKKKLFVLVIILVILVLTGCSYMFPPAPDEAVGGEGDIAKIVPEREDTNAPEADVESIIEEAAKQEEMKQDTAEEPAVNLTNETNMTEEPSLDISGDLELQNDNMLCPHLNDSFQCNKYDLRRCDFKMTVGQNDFYPDLLYCRSGYDYRGENPDYKYCFIQECRPLQKGNVVYAYGGTVAYAEYAYSVDKVEGGIMTNYNLRRCGEELKEFPTRFECTTYKSELRNI